MPLKRIILKWNQWEIMPGKENMNTAKLHRVFYVHLVEGALQHFFHTKSGAVGHYTCAKHQFYPLQRTGICASNNIIIIKHVSSRKFMLSF